MAEEKVPSGSKSVLDVPEQKPDNTPKDDIKSETKQDSPYLGDWKTREDAEKGLGELKKVMGRQGDELGSLRKQYQEVADTLRQFQEKDAARNTQETSGANDELSSILDEYASIDFLDDDNAAKKGASLLQKAISATAKMVKDETLREADSQVRGILQEKDKETVKSKFLEQNPDFLDLQSQGAFQALKSKNPLHDDFSAYFAHRETQAMQRVSELEKALEEAKAVANLAGGDEASRKVFTKPGDTVRGERPKPKTTRELKASALDAVRRAGGG